MSWPLLQYRQASTGPPTDNTPGNVGFVFTNADLKETRDKILSNRVAAPARAGAVAPGDVFVPAGNTYEDPPQRPQLAYS